MASLRISAISFLNTAPLMWDFEHAEGTRAFEIGYTVPSVCAESLLAGSADIGIIPVAAYAQIPNLRIIPGVAIAARGPVESILLVCRKPLEQVKTVATDTSSRASVALLRVLFEKWMGGARRLSPMEPNLRLMLNTCDAALLIGDSALMVDRGQFEIYDLAAEWRRFTGKPFVFAFWAIRGQAVEQVPPDMDLARVFQQSRDHGLAHAQEISSEWAPRLGLPKERILRYLTRSIYYHLDPACQEGLRLFFNYAAELDVLPHVRDLRMLNA